MIIAFLLGVFVGVVGLTVVCCCIAAGRNRQEEDYDE